jgi:type II secretory pathway pseudopilin PulG
MGMKNESGYILLMVLVVVGVISFGIIGLMTRTTEASFLAARRARNIQAFSLAESAAMEGYWYLVNDPTYRTNQVRQWGNDKYSFQIIDSTPSDPNNDIILEVLGEGYIGNQQRKVRLVLARPDLNSTYAMSSWSEDN